MMGQNTLQRFKVKAFSGLLIGFSSLKCTAKKTCTRHVFSLVDDQGLEPKTNH